MPVERFGASARPTLFIDLTRQMADVAAALAHEERIAILARLLRSIEREEDLYLVVTWLAHAPLSPSDPRRLSLGGTLLRSAYARHAGDESASNDSIDGAMFVASRGMAGSVGETIRLLVASRRGAGLESARSEELSVEQVGEIYRRLASLRRIPEKIELLVEVWRMMSPEEIGLFLRITDRSAMRLLATQAMVEQALAAAFGEPVESIRYAAMIEGNTGRTALRARGGELALAALAPFQPIDPMLASELERELDEAGEPRFLPDPSIDLTEYLIEDRLHGIRAQAHVRDDDGETRVALFSRQGADLAASFPEIALALAELPRGTILDGQIMPLAGAGEPRADHLRRRLGARRPGPELVEELPAGFVPFDLLLHGDRPLLAEPLELRRRLLEELAALHGLHVPGQREALDWDRVELEYRRARARGSRGLVLKRRSSGYEFGRRGHSWITAMKEAGAIPAVIRYVTSDGGRHGGTLADFTFGIWRELEDGTRRLVNVGKADGGYAEAELAELDRRLRPLLGKRFGTTYEVVPEIVCLVAYDAIEPNGRTEAGFTLGSARIRAVLHGAGPESVATVAEVARRFELEALPPVSDEPDGDRAIVIPALDRG